jgi:hypothetical protein
MGVGNKVSGVQETGFYKAKGGKKSVAKGWNMPLKIFYPTFELLMFHVDLVVWVPLSCQIGGSSFVQHLPLSRRQPFNRETQCVPKGTSDQPSIQ